ncbi:MAG: metal ABC transporter ATP-binding protein [Planctomycetota bacterium]|nr:metal ABC transporter ATP-binding protein [Planctomycetota bacterium]
MSHAAIELEHVGFTYPTGARALEGVSLRVEEGSTLAVVGPNGGGKSTLLKILLGVMGGYEGSVRLFGMSPEAARRAGVVGYVPQRSEAELSFPVSGRGAVEMGATSRLGGLRRVPGDVRAHVESCLRLVGAESFAERPVGQLSGGQWQRVLIARALAARPRILALDEPLVGIDAPGQRLFAELLASLRRDLRLTIVLVTHDLRTVAGAAPSCDQVACLRRTLHFHAAPGGVTPQVLAQVFQHDLADVFGDVHVDAHRAAECGHDHGGGGGGGGAGGGVVPLRVRPGGGV